MTKIRTGIIGVGTWGKTLLRVFNDISDVRMCANKHDISYVSNRYPEIRTTLDYRELLDNNEIEAVVIAVPHDELFTIGLEAIRKGKHVLIEKPMCSLLSQAETLRREAREDRVLFTGYTFMYSNMFRYLKKVSLSDPIVYLDMNWEKFGTFGNDILLNLVSHDIAIALSLLNNNPDTIVASQKTTDQITVRMGTNDGKKADIKVNRRYPRSEKSVRAITASGREFVWIDKNLFEMYDNGMGLVSRASEEPILTECREFLSCIDNNTKPITDSDLACKVLDIIGKIKETTRRFARGEKDYVIKRYNKPDGLPEIRISDLFTDLCVEVEPFTFLGGGSSPLDIALLMKLAQTFDKCRYLEIGTWRGESACNMARITESCYSVDLSDEDLRKRDLPEQYIKNMRYLSKENGKVNHVICDSASLSRSKLGVFDLIFIDGDHSYENILQDTKTAFKMLRDKTSVIVWHDYGRRPEETSWRVLSAILDGTPEDSVNDLYHVSGTISAMYMKGLDIKTRPMMSYPIPSEIFKVRVRF